MMNETFSKNQIISALESYFDFGKEKEAGYFCNGGWAGRVMFYHLDQLKNPVEDINTDRRDAVEVLITMGKITQEDWDAALRVVGRMKQILSKRKTN